MYSDLWTLCWQWSDLIGAVLTWCCSRRVRRRKRKSVVRRWSTSCWTRKNVNMNMCELSWLGSRVRRIHGSRQVSCSNDRSHYISMICKVWSILLCEILYLMYDENLTSAMSSSIVYENWKHPLRSWASGHNVVEYKCTLKYILCIEHFWYYTCYKFKFMLCYYHHHNSHSHVAGCFGDKPF